MEKMNNIVPKVKIELCDNCKKIQHVTYTCIKCENKITLHGLSAYCSVTCSKECGTWIPNIFHTCNANPSKREKRNECHCPYEYLNRLECDCDLGCRCGH